MRKDFLWVRQNIQSCTNLFQTDCCYALITLFTQKYTIESKFDTQSLIETLEAKQIMISCETIDA